MDGAFARPSPDDGGAAPPSGSTAPGLWVAVAARLAPAVDAGRAGTVQSDDRYAGAGRSGAGLWRALDDRLDLGSLIPIPVAGVVVRALTGRDGERYYVLRSPTRRYVRLDPTDFALWQRIDGRSTVREIAVAQFVERGEFVAERLARLIHVLRAGGFVGPAVVDGFAALRGRLQQSVWRRLGRPVVRLFSAPLARLADPDRLFGAAYRAGGWLLFTRPAQVLWLAVVLVGLVTWWYEFTAATHALFQTRGSYRLGFLVLALLDSAGISLYGVIQGLAMKHYGHDVTDAGVALSGVIPAAYVETSDLWLAERRERLAISWAGPYAMLVLSALLAILSVPFAGSELGATLFKGATIWLANTLFNLLPVVDSAGYLMLVDYLEMPGLRARARELLGHGLLGAIAAPWRVSRDEWIAVAFGLASVATYLLVPLAILEARDLRYADALQDLWERPEAGARLLAVAIGLLFLGPAAFTLLHRLLGLLRWLAAPIRHLWRVWRARVPAEDVALLAGLPFLRGATPAELTLIARHLDSRSAPAGTTLIRQGDPPDRLYLLRAGVVQVTKAAADGRTVVLARLRAGDYFGETALLAGVRRTANVVAETPVRLLALRGGHVRRWLAGRPGVVEALRRSLAERERLERLPLFQGLSTAELDRLAERLLVTRYLPGNTIVRQGAPGDRFYIIVEGEVEVGREAAGSQTRLATLGPGDHFGELALLYQAPRSATVRALTAVETYTLSAEDFRELLSSGPAADTLHAVARQRRGPSVTTPLPPGA